MKRLYICIYIYNFSNVAVLKQKLRNCYTNPNFKIAFFQFQKLKTKFSFPNFVSKIKRSSLRRNKPIKVRLKVGLTFLKPLPILEFFQRETFCLHL
jgi:hypothetical protein